MVALTAMLPTNFRLTNHKLGFLGSLGRMAFDVFAEGEKAACAALNVQFISEGVNFFTIQLLDASGAVRETFRCDESQRVMLYGSVWSDAIYNERDLIRPIAYVAYASPKQDLAFKAATASLSTPILLQVLNGAFHEVHLYPETIKLSEVHQTWRDADRAAGIRSTFQLSPNLDEPRHHLALVSAILVAGMHAACF